MTSRFVSPVASSRYKTSCRSSCAWRETLRLLCRVCSPQWTPPPPASLHISSSFISASSKQQQHQSWRPVGRHSSAILMQRGNQSKVRHRSIIDFYTLLKNGFLRNSLPPLSRCCTADASYAGEVCSQGSKILPCCLHWCESTTLITVRFAF